VGGGGGGGLGGPEVSPGLGEKKRQGGLGGVAKRVACPRRLERREGSSKRKPGDWGGRKAGSAHHSAKNKENYGQKRRDLVMSGFEENQRGDFQEGKF